MGLHIPISLVTLHTLFTENLMTPPSTQELCTTRHQAENRQLGRGPQRPRMDFFKSPYKDQGLLQHEILVERK